MWTGVSSQHLAFLASPPPLFLKFEKVNLLADSSHFFPLNAWLLPQKETLSKKFGDGARRVRDLSYWPWFFFEDGGHATQWFDKLHLQMAKRDAIRTDLTITSKLITHDIHTCTYIWGGDDRYLHTYACMNVCMMYICTPLYVCMYVCMCRSEVESMFSLPRDQYWRACSFYL
jgi:hypothetical protein